jgi:hypothetical protein
MKMKKKAAKQGAAFLRLDDLLLRLADRARQREFNAGGICQTRQKFIRHR